MLIMTNQKNKVCLIILFVFLLAPISFAQIDGENGNILKKTESVYVNVDSYGNVEKVNIYNYFDIANIDEIIDYGEYDEIQTVTGDNKPIISGDKLIWKTSGDTRLGYVGKASNELANQMPWTIEIKYYLNGVETLASELPHKSGLVKASIKVIPNKEAPKVYQNNYMMQISTSFDMTNYLSVHSDEAIEAQVGNTKSLTFMILPGHEKEVNIEIGTEDFKMNNITFAMVPLEGDMLELIKDIVKDKKSIREAWDATNESLDVILNGLSNSTKSIDKIINENKKSQNALEKINNDTNQRLENINEAKFELTVLKGELENINSEITLAIENIEYIKKRTNETKEIINKLNDDLKILNSKLEENEKDLKRIEKRSKDLESDLGTIHNLIVDIQSAIVGLKKLLGSIDATGDINIKDLSSSLYSIKNSTESIAQEAGARLQAGGSDAEFYLDVISTAQSIGKNLKTVSEDLSEAQELLDDTNTNTSKLSKSLDSIQRELLDVAEIVEGLQEYSKDVPTTISNLNETINSISTLIADITNDLDENMDIDNAKLNEQIDVLTNTLKSLQIVEKDFKLIENTAQNSLSLLEKDINTISTDMYSGVDGTINGLNELMKNLKTITSQSSALKKSKNQIYDVITSDVDDIENKTTIFDMDPDMLVSSFASTKNDSPKKVQIFVQTEAIKEVKINKNIDLEPEKEKTSFLEKIMVILDKVIGFFKGLFGK